MNLKIRTKSSIKNSVIVSSLIPVIKSRYFYIGLISLIGGLALNVASQTYLHNYISEGKTLPVLSDLILDNLPVIDVSLIYDIVALIPIILAIIVLGRFFFFTFFLTYINV